MKVPDVEQMQAFSASVMNTECQSTFPYAFPSPNQSLTLVFVNKLCDVLDD